MNTGEMIKHLRIEKGYTLEQLGDLVGVGKSTIRKWENGMIANMKRDKIAKLADALDVSPVLFVNFDGNNISHACEMPLKIDLSREDVKFISAQGLDIRGADVDTILKNAKESVKELL